VLPFAGLLGFNKIIASESTTEHKIGDILEFCGRSHPDLCGRKCIVIQSEVDTYGVVLLESNKTDATSDLYHPGSVLIKPGTEKSVRVVYGVPKDTASRLVKKI